MPIEFTARFSKLTQHQQNQLAGWRRCVNGAEGADGPKSLWIYGERGAGSSYIGTCALHRIVLDHYDWDYEYFTAQKVMEARRTMWDISRQLPTEDPALMDEYLSIEEDFRFLWEKAQIIFIDNMHATLDLGFWRKHIYQPLEERVKAGKPAIIATSVSPNHPAFEDITRVIESTFVIVHATR
jgi:DNA replication protein DnaC